MGTENISPVLGIENTERSIASSIFIWNSYDEHKCQPSLVPTWEVTETSGKKEMKE